MITPRTAARAAFFAASANGVAALAMLVFLREGLPGGGNDLARRIDHVQANTAAWRLGWLCWNVAAISLLVFYVALALRWFRQAPLRTSSAVVVAAAGLGADLTAEAILMIASPAASGADYGTLETIGIALTGFVANGLYTVAGIALTTVIAREMPKPLLILAIPVWGAGIALSVTTLVGSDTGAVVSTSVLMPLFILWAFGIGIWLRSRAS